MEVSIRIPDLGTEHVVEVRSGDTVGSLRERVCEMHALDPRDTELAPADAGWAGEGDDGSNSDGSGEGAGNIEDLFTDDDTPVQDLPVEGGGTLLLRLHTRRVEAELLAGTLHYMDCPEWARFLRPVQRAAVVASAYNLVFAGDGLQGDRDFLLSCLRDGEDASLLFFASPELRRDKAFLLEAMSVASSAFDVADRELLQDTDFCMHAVTLDAARLKFLPREMVTRAFAVEAVKANAACILFMPLELRKDPEVMLEVVAQDASYLAQVHTPLARDTSFLRRAIARNPDVVTYNPPPKRRRVAYV